MKNGKKTAAVIVAAGKGLRMGGTKPKQYLMLAEEAVLTRTIRCFEESCVDGIYVVCPAGDEEYVRDTILKDDFLKIKAIVPGGAERFDSCSSGIKAAAADRPDYILVHDGVRALVTNDVIENVVCALEKHNVVCPGVPVKDTIRLADKNGYSAGTPDRRSLMAIQTPQGFRTGVLTESYAAFETDRRLKGGGVPNVTDDAMLAERYLGERIFMVEGSYENIKLTTAEDMLWAEAILKNRNEKNPK